MKTALEETVRQLGEGSIVDLPSGEPLFRLDPYEHNPVVKPQDLGLTWREDGTLRLGAVFNGGAELLGGRVILLPRCQRGYRESTFYDERLGVERRCLEDYVSEVWPLVSEDGVRFTRLGDSVIRGDGTDHQEFTHGVEDLRIVRHGDRYLVVGCGKIRAPFKETDADRIAVYSTIDFSEIAFHGIVGPFDSRNAVPFPEAVGDRHPILLRFYPNIHLDFLDAGIDQLLDPSAHESRWRQVYERRDETLLFKVGRYPHEKEKLGPGAQLVKTEKGWLMIYHAVGVVGDEIARVYGLRERIERGYTVCAALLDLEDPRRVLARSRRPIYVPSAPHELYGDEEHPVDVPAVVFPVGAFRSGDKLLVYAGAGDKYTILLGCRLPSLLTYLLKHCRVGS